MLFSLDDCTNCRANMWRLGFRKKDRTEFICAYCGAVVTVLLTKDQFRRVAGGD